MSDLADAVFSFGWAIVDPWDAKQDEDGAWIAFDSGPICVACGRAAPPSNEWPTLDTFRDPINHGDDCPLFTEANK